MPHIHEKVDFTSEVYIVCKNKVLLRKHDKFKIWLSVGGHIELDEDPVRAAIREAKEEVGLDIKMWDARTFKQTVGDVVQLNTPEFMYRHKVNETHDHVTLGFFAYCENEEFQNEGNEASEELRWFTKEELSDDVFGLLPHVAFYAKTALEKLAE